MTLWDSWHLHCIMIKFKIFLQKLCWDKLEWDEPLPDDLFREWKELAADLSEGGPISVLRSYVHNVNEEPSSMTLSVFVMCPQKHTPP